MNVESLSKMYMDRLSELYDSERQVLNALPQMAEACCSYRVQELLQRHLGETPEHLARLDEVFASIEARPGRVKSTTTRELLAEAQRLIEEEVDLEAIDAGFINLIQQWEEYGLAAYENACELGQALGHKDAVKLLQRTINEEEDTAELVRSVVERFMPKPAMAI